MYSDDFASSSSQVCPTLCISSIPCHKQALPDSISDAITVTDNACLFHRQKTHRCYGKITYKHAFSKALERIKHFFSLEENL
jgi:hypothetical protein